MKRNEDLADCKGNIFADCWARVKTTSHSISKKEKEKRKKKIEIPEAFDWAILQQKESIQ